MAHTLQRLTLYALLSSLERDLREFLLLHIAPLVGRDKILPDAMLQKCLERYRKDSNEQSPEIDVLTEYLDLPDEIQLIRSHDNSLDNSTKKYISNYYIGLESLIPTRNRVMHSRPLEFSDMSRVADLSAELVRSHPSLWANLRSTRRQLDKNPEFVASLSIPDVTDSNTSVLHNLPEVEFDDTGFVGRDRELRDLKRALLGAYPVVTVVGEGGLGKTALALKACYDLLDEPGSKLDAIIWTTAKATKLTINDIEVIEGAVVNSLGIIERAAETIGRQKNTSAFDDLVSHLTNNKILLVIDNLETVIDVNIRELVKRVPTGSRILFTTRIGLGAYELPIPLMPLERKEAAFYFRQTARVRGVYSFATASNAIVEGYCQKLQQNPLFIKWFIQCVQVGKRPSSLTNEPEILLKFCLQNVFNSLSQNSKTIASVLASLGSPQSIAGLAFFSDFDSLTVQGALSLLITSNLVAAERGRSAEDEDRYVLSPLSRMYIQRFIRPSLDEQRLLIRKQNSLRTAQENYAARSRGDIFDMKNIEVRDKDDYIVATVLTQAVEAIFRSRYPEAENLIEKAFGLSPNYYECHRVRAFFNVETEDLFAANDSYQAAIALAADKAPLRFWYGGFLSRYFGDNDQALKEFERAEQLTSDSAIVKLELARILQFLRRFDDAQGRLDAIKDINSLPAKTRRIHVDISLQNFIRRADLQVTDADFSGALQSLELARNLFQVTPRALVDDKTLRTISKALRLITPLERAFAGLQLETRFKIIQSWVLNPLDVQASRVLSSSYYETKSALAVHSGDEAVSIPNRGRLVNAKGNYGFVESAGARLFFHRGNWIGASDFVSLSEGSIVEFNVARTEKGLIATNVYPVGEAPTRKSTSSFSYGKIKSKDEKYGFVSVDGGSDLFFHKSHCLHGSRFSLLRVSDRVRFLIDRRSDGKLFAADVELFSGAPY